MQEIEESGIRFSFPDATAVEKHDSPNGNRVWPGVDFIINQTELEIRLEVKNWEPSTIETRRRGGVRRRFLAEISSDDYYTKVLRGKFIGTTAYLYHTGQLTMKATLYVVLLESPRLDPALKAAALKKLKAAIQPNHPAWTQPIDVAIMDLSDWNRLYPDYAGVAI